jgi:hypothetical protein
MKIAHVALAALLFAASPALARPVADIEVAETLSSEGKTLKLNGAGIRKKFVVKVYVGALYLEETSTDPATIIKSDAVRVVKMTFLREVEKAKLIGAFKEGFENNSAAKSAALLPHLDKIAAAIGDAKNGTVMTVSYAPGKGTTIAMQGSGSVTIEGKDFADAMFLNWIGNKPADKGLKTEMLAGK